MCLLFYYLVIGFFHNRLWTSNAEKEGIREGSIVIVIVFVIVLSISIINFIMSGAPNKRSHEESGHSDGGGATGASSYPKLSSDYHPIPPYDISQDARLPKIPRTDSHLDRGRSPLPSSLCRIPDSHLDSNNNNPPSEDARDHNRFETRDTKTDSYADPRRDSQNPKPEKDDNKDTKHERETYTDVKTDKDAYALTTTTYLNWKDSKDYHRGKRHSDGAAFSFGPAETWFRTNSQLHPEASTTEERERERDHVDPQDTVGENKFDDKFKDKDRKRKDVKHRDWGEREKERVDRKTTLQVANSTTDDRESTKEERDAERWERERKDPTKDKERVKEREKDHAKRDSWGMGMDYLGDGGPNRLPDQDNLMFDKKQKESESWKTVDKESRDRKKEREAEGDGDRPEKHNRGFEKESDDGSADAETAMEREREVHNYGVQQRKRMQRSRGSPQVANREPRFRPRPQDNEGCVILPLPLISFICKYIEVAY